MDERETNSSSDYGKPPWVFKGSALYQLHLVKAETARAFIPKEFKLVEAFGYTLGGFFLADYKDSPVGAFDELVVIAGIVWNPPTSCAWAARVLVNNDKACIHGRKEVGLPSQVANFEKRVSALAATKKGRFGDLLHRIGITEASTTDKDRIDLQVTESNSPRAINIFNINLSPESQNDSSNWFTPAIKMSLPSFSGRTEHNPHLLRYSCQIKCRLRPAKLTKVSDSSPFDNGNEFNSDFEKNTTSSDSDQDHKRDLSRSVMLSKPILALEFNSLTMTVESPVQVSQ